MSPGGGGGGDKQQWVAMRGVRGVGGVLTSGFKVTRAGVRAWGDVLWGVESREVSRSHVLVTPAGAVASRPLTCRLRYNYTTKSPEKNNNEAVKMN